ncbi:MAG: hypothetical protein AB8B99_11240 [Phormidesmis sp.]
MFFADSVNTGGFNVTGSDHAINGAAIFGTAIFIEDPLSHLMSGVAGFAGLALPKPSLALTEQIDALLRETRPELNLGLPALQKVNALNEVSGSLATRSFSHHSVSHHPFSHKISHKRDSLLGDVTGHLGRDRLAPFPTPVQAISSISPRLDNLVTATSESVFIPREQQITEDNSIVDPEFDPLSNRVTWQDQSNNLWVAPIETDTGLINTAQAQLIDSGLVPISSYRDRTGTGNGPEWIYEQGEAQIVYTKAVDGQPRLARTQGNGLALTPEILSGPARTNTGVAPIGSLDTSSSDARIAYLLPTPPDISVLAWRDVDQPEGHIVAENVSSAGRWINNENNALTFTQSVAGINQVFSYEVSTRQLTQLTSSDVQKSDPFIWQAPELNDEPLLLVRESEDLSRLNKTPQLGIYRQVDGSWSKIDTLQPPSDLALLRSAEPFVHEGRSYISFLAEDEKGGPSEVWIASPDLESLNASSLNASSLNNTGSSTEDTSSSTDSSEPNFYRQVSDPNVSLVRNDPEVFTTDTDVFVYYTARGTGDVYRAETGL